MIYLALSVLFSSFIYVMFSLIGKRKTPLLPSLVVNYIVAGAFSYGYAYATGENFSYPWLYNALGISVLFISIFIVMAKTTQQFGLATASVASKMSVVVPVIVAIIWLDESVTVLKVCGLMLGLLSVLIMSKPPKNQQKAQAKASGNWLLPVILFLGSGCIDTLLKVTEETYFKGLPSTWFIGTVFSLAGLFGLLYRATTTKKGPSFTRSALVLGAILGVVNFGSIYFILQSLALPNLEASVVFPINNVAIVALSTFLGWTLFAQKLTINKVLGLCLAVVAVILLY